jgi:hypothetical protein
MLTTWNAQYEIHDEKGMLYSGSLQKMRYAWDVILLNDIFFEKKYGTLIRDNKYKISDWTGVIKFVQVLDKL